NYTNQTSWQTFADNVPAEIIISGLQADTKYFYRVRYRHPGTTTITNRPEFNFHTQRSIGSSFTFIVQADPHLDASSDTALYRRCLQNQLEDAPDFMIDLGDFLMSDKLKNASNVIPHDTIPFRCNLLRSYYETECHSVPLFITLGNHEGESGWYQNGTANNVAIWDAQERNKYFMNPAPDNFYSGDTSFTNYVGKRKSYYAWQWGDALFMVIDPYWYTKPKPDSLHGWRWTLGETQYNWLKNTLENSNAKFKFIFSHQIVGGTTEGRGGVEVADLYEWGGNNLDGTPGFASNRPGWYKPIKELLAENHVNIFFHGHDHFFGKQEKDCLIYQETPQPSLPNFQNPPQQAADYGYIEGQILPNSGYLRVTVDANGVTVNYVRVYLPQQEDATHHNKDVAATYFIGNVNCYDSLNTGAPILWNSNYEDQLVYPNPFNNETKIEFAVNQSEKINLNVYNENGLIVRKLIAGNIIPQGKFQIIWDGKDGLGNSLPNGIYWYSLQSEKSEVKNGKIV
ncbi:MAG: metallophosphoesterase, partial [Pseudomonadota bacterium]